MDLSIESSLTMIAAQEICGHVRNVCRHIFELIELPTKLLDYFLWSNTSNINQTSTYTAMNMVVSKGRDRKLLLERLSWHVGFLVKPCALLVRSFFVPSSRHGRRGHGRRGHGRPRRGQDRLRVLSVEGCEEVFSKPVTQHAALLLHCPITRCVSCLPAVNPECRVGKGSAGGGKGDRMVSTIKTDYAGSPFLLH